MFYKLKWFLTTVIASNKFIFNISINDSRDANSRWACLLIRVIISNKKKNTMPFSIPNIHGNSSSETAQIGLWVEYTMQVFNVGA